MTFIDEPTIGRRGTRALGGGTVTPRGTAPSISPTTTGLLAGRAAGSTVPDPTAAAGRGGVRLLPGAAAPGAPARAPRRGGGLNVLQKIGVLMSDFARGFQGQPPISLQIIEQRRQREQQNLENAVGIIRLYGQYAEICRDLPDEERAACIQGVDESLGGVAAEAGINLPSFSSFIGDLSAAGVDEKTATTVLSTAGNFHPDILKAVIQTTPDPEDLANLVADTARVERLQKVSDDKTAPEAALLIHEFAETIGPGPYPDKIPAGDVGRTLQESGAEIDPHIVDFLVRAPTDDPTFFEPFAEFIELPGIPTAEAEGAARRLSLEEFEARERIRAEVGPPLTEAEAERRAAAGATGRLEAERVVEAKEELVQVSGDIARVSNALQTLNRLPGAFGLTGFLAREVALPIGTVNEGLGRALTEQLTGGTPEDVSAIFEDARSLIAQNIQGVGAGPEEQRFTDIERRLTEEALRLTSPGSPPSAVRGAMTALIRFHLAREDRLTFEAKEAYRHDLKAREGRRALMQELVDLGFDAKRDSEVIKSTIRLMQRQRSRLAERL